MSFRLTALAWPRQAAKVTHRGPPSVGGNHELNDRGEDVDRSVEPPPLGVPTTLAIVWVLPHGIHRTTTQCCSMPNTLSLAQAFAIFSAFARCVSFHNSFAFKQGWRLVFTLCRPKGTLGTLRALMSFGSVGT